MTSRRVASQDVMSNRMTLRRRVSVSSHQQRLRQRRAPGRRAPGRHGDALIALIELLIDMELWELTDNHHDLWNANILKRTERNFLQLNSFTKHNELCTCVSIFQPF